MLFIIEVKAININEIRTFHCKPLISRIAHFFSSCIILCFSSSILFAFFNSATLRSTSASVTLLDILLVRLINNSENIWKTVREQESCLVWKLAADWRQWSVCVCKVISYLTGNFSPQLGAEIIKNYYGLLKVIGLCV